MTPEIGGVVNIAGIQWIVLDKDEDSVLCLTREFVSVTCFDEDSNDYAQSSIRERLNHELLPKIIKAVGKENVYPTVIDLTSDDGLDDYGYVKDMIGLLTCDAYRKYNRIIEKYPVSNWWWLATPFSTEHRGYSYAVRCVHYDGALSFSNCYYGNGVRPFCIFKSLIFES